jgi:hypothetical protein
MLARALLLSLLLMNLGVAAWWWLRTPPPEAVPAAVDPGVAPLQLLSETEAPDTGAISADAEAVGQPADVGIPIDQRCLQIGPFLTQADLRRAINALSPAVSRIQFRESRVLTNRGFWVYLPAQGTREAALASARELSSQGLRDYYVVTAGDQENTISLGLFRDRGNADTRKREVEALGFKPELQERTEEIPNYWIELAASPDFDWRERLGGYAGVDSQSMPCE